MPAIIAAVSAYSAGTLTVAAVAAAALEAYAIYSTVEGARAAKRAARQAKDAGAADRLVTVRSSAASKQIVVGQTRVAGPTIAYTCSHGTKKEFITVCIPLAAHEVESIDDVWFNDQSIGTLDGTATTSGGGGWVTTTSKFYKHDVRLDTIYSGGGYSASDTVTISDAINFDSIAELVNGGNEDQGQRKMVLGTDYTISGLTITFLVSTTNPVVITYRRDFGRPLVRVKKFLGIAAGERDTDLESDSPIVSGSTHEFASTMVGKGVARLHVTIEYDQDIFGAIGMPNITAIVKGAKFRNWSTGVTEWTQNAAQIAAGYLMHPLGRGLAVGRFDEDAMLAAEASCAEDVPVSALADQARYTCGGVLRCDASWKDNLKQILDAMAGSAVVSGGQWVIRAGVYESPTYTLDDSDFADGEITVAPAPSANALFNSIRGTFTAAPTARDSGRLYATSDFQPYSSSTYVTEDGGFERWTDVSLPLIQDDLQAERVGLLLLRRHRLGLTLSATFKLAAWPLQVGDRVYVKSDLFGWTALNSGAGKIFVVLKRRFAPTGTIEMVMQEDAAAVYAHDYTELTGIDPAPNTALPDPTYVAPISNVTITSGSSTYSRLSDGSIIPRVEISWDEITDQGVLNGGRVFYIWKSAESTVFKNGTSSPGDSAAASRKLYLEPVSAGQVLNIGIYLENGLGVRSAPVFATYTVSSDLTSGRLVATSNRLRNASFDQNTGGWSTAEVGIASGLVELLKPTAGNGYPNSHIKGTPANALMRIFSAATGNGYAGVITTDEVAVIAGEQLAVYVSAIGWATDVFMQVEWLDANGDSMGSAQSQTLTGVPVDTLTAQWSQEEHYTRLEVSPMPVVPTGARTARMLVYGMGNWLAGSWKYVSIMKPMIGGMPVGVTQLPTWSAGGMNSFDPILMPSGTAVQYTKLAFATAHSMIVPLAIQSDFTLATIDAEVPGEAFVTLQAEIDTTYIGTLRAGLFDPNLKAWDGGTVVFAASSTAGQRIATVTFVQTIPVERGQTLTPTFRLSHSLAPNITDIGSTRSAKLVGKIEIYRE